MFVYIVTCILSPFLLATKSGVSILPENKRDKTCTTFVCFFSILAEVVPQLFKIWFTILLFYDEPCLVLVMFYSAAEVVKILSHL